MDHGVRRARSGAAPGNVKEMVKIKPKSIIPANRDLAAARVVPVLLELAVQPRRAVVVPGIVGEVRHRFDLSGGVDEPEDADRAQTASDCKWPSERVGE